MHPIRRLARLDRDALLAHWQALTDAERRDRFHAPISDSALAAFVDRIDWRRTLMLGLFDAGRPRGVAMLGFLDPPRPGVPPETAELAVDLEGAWRGRGLGRLLTERACAAAANRGAREALILTLPGNRPMRAIAAGLGARARLEDGTVILSVPLPAATAGSRMLEATREAAGAWADLADRARPPIPWLDAA